MRLVRQDGQGDATPTGIQSGPLRYVEGRKMHKTKKKKLESYEARLKAQREREVTNRRKLLAKLKPDVRELAIREFAKLGLTQ